MCFVFIRESLNSRVRDCVRCYTSPWLLVQHRYQEYSSGNLIRHSGSRLNALSATPRQEFEIDIESDVFANPDDDNCSSDIPLSVPKVLILFKCYVFL